MVTIFINNKKMLVPSNISILYACNLVGINIPKFCYKEYLSIAGTCRMCLVSISTNGAGKPVASCATAVTPNMKVFTDTPYIKVVRENILEMLLLNHPLDCPICDQGGECDLQEQSLKYGSQVSKVFVLKTSKLTGYLNPLVSSIFSRCILCSRCIRFSREVNSDYSLSIINRGINSSVSLYNQDFIMKGEFSSNVVDLCPVGALTFSNSSFKSRPWELDAHESIDLSDSLGSSIYVFNKNNLFNKILPRKNKNFNNFWLSDKGRFESSALQNKNFDLQTVNSLFTNKEELKLKTRLFLINSNTSLENMAALKNASIVSSGEVQVKVFSSSLKYSNLSTSSVLSIPTITKNTTIFLIATFLRFECSMLNLFIKANLKTNSTIVSSGVFGQNLFKSTLISLRVKDILLFLSGKSIVYSKRLFKSQFNFFFFGKLLVRRLPQTFFRFLKMCLSNSVFYNILSFSNEAALPVLNIKQVTTKNLRTSNLLYSINLEDMLLVRRLFHSYKGYGIYISSFYSAFFKNSRFSMFSIKTYMEESGTFLNLFNLPQKYRGLDTRVSSLIALNQFITSICSKYKFFLVEKPSRFLTTFYLNIWSSFTYYYSNFKFLRLGLLHCVVILHAFQSPTGRLFENFYLTSSLGLNSSILRTQYLLEYESFKSEYYL